MSAAAPTKLWAPTCCYCHRRWHVGAEWVSEPSADADTRSSGICPECYEREVRPIEIEIERTQAK